MTMASVARPVSAPGRAGRVIGARAVAPPTDGATWWIGIASVFAIWRLQEIIPGAAALKLPAVTLAIAIGVFFMSRPISDLASVFRGGPMQWVVVMTALAVFGAPFALIRSDALVFLLYDFAPTLLLCVFLAATVRSATDARAILALVALGGVAFCLYSRLNGYIDASGRPAGIVYYDANDLALNAATTLALCSGLAHTTRSKFARLLWVSIAIFLLSTVLWSGSRGSFLALLAMAAYLLFSPIMPLARRGIFIVISAVGIIAVGGRRYLDTIGSMLNPSADYNFSGKSPNGRGELWKRGLTYVYDRPILGAGVRNYTSADGRSSFALGMARQGRGVKWSRAHNSYLEIAVEMGLPGLITFAAIVFGSLTRIHRRSRRGKLSNTDVAKLSAYLAAALVTYAVGGFFLSAEYWPLLYTLVGISAALTLGTEHHAATGVPNSRRRAGSLMVRSAAGRASAMSPPYTFG